MGWSGWESLGGNINTAPAVGSNEDGRLEVFAIRRIGTGIRTAGDIQHIWQKRPIPPTWSGWHNLITIIILFKTPSSSTNNPQTEARV
jgi:hypothetical protein